MKEFLEYIVKQLVDNPEEVHVKEVKGEHLTVYELRVVKTDMGKVIGKRGQTAQAIRMLLTAASKGTQRSILEIVE
jgi:predicted RNA-binding protein YlqC (UPF0109 family)